MGGRRRRAPKPTLGISRRYWCEAHDKLLFPSRAAASLAGLGAYRCDAVPGHFHQTSRYASLAGKAARRKAAATEGPRPVAVSPRVKGWKKSTFRQRADRAAEAGRAQAEERLRLLFPDDHATAPGKPDGEEGE